MQYKVIFRMFYFDGLTPSQIDKKLKLINGTARRVIVEYWKWSGLDKN